MLLSIAAATGRSSFEVEDWKSWLEAGWRASYAQAAPGPAPFEDFWFALLQAGAVTVDGRH